MSRQIGAKRQKYAPEILEHAAELVRSKSMTLNQAAKKYSVPKTTLQNAVHHKYGRHKVGHKIVLSDLEEKRIADWAMHMARIGHGRTRQELVNTVKKILDNDGRQTPFRDNRPGRSWLDGFFGRHPELSLRTTIQLGKERAIISAEKVDKWFCDFKSYIESEVADKDLLSDPTRIYNADETGVSLCLKGNQVVGFKEAPVMYHYGNSDKTQITVMAACSAAAHFLPPMIIFPGKRFGYDPLEGFEEAALGRSESGWMDSEVFCQWLENVFVPGVNARNVKKPVLLLIDGHSTHVTMKASDICLQSGVELYCLLPHASHVMQPLDLRMFSALKRNWRQSVRDWQSEHVGEYVTKVTFSRVFRKAWEASTTTDIAVKGFQEAGLFPLDSNAVTSSIKIEPSKIFSPSLSSMSLATDKQNEEEVQLPAENSMIIDEEFSENSIAVAVNSQGIRQEDHPQADSNLSRTQENGESAQQIAQPAIANEEPSVPKLNTSNPPSPFSKHLMMPTPKLPKSKATGRVALPKAITGLAYRKLMEDKKAQKEEEERAKERRKEERLRKRKMREEEKVRKMAEKEAKRKQRAEGKRRKRELREKLLSTLAESDSESDHEVQVDSMKCYTCEQTYTTDYIECTKCFRRFHINCVSDDYISVEGLEFGCKYC